MENVIHTDICIAGSGAAGIAAAVAASRLGMKVCIIEKNSFPGGRATASAVGTICGLYLRSHKKNPEFVMNGFPREFGERVLQAGGKKPVKFSEGLWFIPSRPEDFEKVAMSFFRQEEINPVYDASIVSVESSTHLLNELICDHNGKNLRIVPSVFIDCSGEGIIGRLAQHRLITDKEYQAAAVVFEMKNVHFASDFNLDFILMKHLARNIESGKLPAFFELLSIVPGSAKQGSILFKLGLPWKVNEEDDKSELMKESHRMIAGIRAFLKENIPGFEHSEPGWIAKEIGARTGIRLEGKSLLSDEDVFGCVKYDDAIAHGSWPVEYWKTGDKRVGMTYFNENDFYSIRAGCIESGEKENLLFAGKLISASENAIASARVIGTCFGTGHAAGVLASFKIKNRSREEAIEFNRSEILKR